MMLKLETICKTQKFNNGATPTWCHGNSLICRVGDRVFVTNPQFHPEREKLNCTHMQLFEKKDGGAWRLVYDDDGVFQREPCYPLYLGDNRLAVVANPTARQYAPDEPSMYVDCVPMVYLFDISDGGVRKVDTVPIPWDDPGYKFGDHSYRSSAVDKETGTVIFTNQYRFDYGDRGAHCYSVLDHDRNVIRNGKLQFPRRSCHHNIAMKDGETYVFGLRDVVEPVEEWRQYKFEQTGMYWDYDCRHMYLLYSPDITKEDFGSVQDVCDEDATCGRVLNLDCSYDRNGDVWLLTAQRSIWKTCMRDRFFPDTKLEEKFMLYRYSKGVQVEKHLLDCVSMEGRLAAEAGFFHTASDGTLYVVWSNKVTDDTSDTESGASSDRAANHIVSAKTGVWMKRLDDLAAEPVKLTDEAPSELLSLFGSKTRLGAEAGDILDLYWVDNGEICYARYDLPGDRQK